MQNVIVTSRGIETVLNILRVLFSRWIGIQWVGGRWVGPNMDIESVVG